MFNKFAAAAVVIIATAFATNVSAQANTGYNNSGYASNHLTQLIRGEIEPAPYRLQPRGSVQRQPQRIVEPRYDTGCAWAAYQQCQNERARGSNVICYYPSN